MKFRIALGIGLIGLWVAMASFITADEPAFPHPPRYEDVWQILSQVDFRDPKLDPALKEKALAAFEAMKLTPQDLLEIRKKNDPTLWIGAGIQDTSAEGVQLLWEATQKQPEQPVAQAAFLYRYLARTFDREAFQKKTPQFEGVEKILERLEKAAPENALGDYLESFAALRNKDENAIFAALTKAREKKLFDPYMREMHRYVIASAEAIGYSKFTAQCHGQGQGCGLTLFLSIEWAALDYPHRKEAPSENLLLGQRLAKCSKTLLEELAGLGIQEHAFKALGADEHKKDLDAIRERKKQLNAMADQMQLLAKDDSFGEAEFVGHCDFVLASSEQEAITRLLKARQKP